MAEEKLHEQEAGMVAAIAIAVPVHEEVKTDVVDPMMR